MVSPVSTEMGDRLWASIPPRYVTKPTRSSSRRSSRGSLRGCPCRSRGIPAYVTDHSCVRRRRLRSRRVRRRRRSAADSCLSPDTGSSRADSLKRTPTDRHVDTNGPTQYTMLYDKRSSMRPLSQRPITRVLSGARVTKEH